MGFGSLHLPDQELLQKRSYFMAAACFLHYTLSLYAEA